MLLLSMKKPAEIQMKYKRQWQQNKPSISIAHKQVVSNWNISVFLVLFFPRLCLLPLFARSTLVSTQFRSETQKKQWNEFSMNFPCIKTIFHRHHSFNKAAAAGAGAGTVVDITYMDSVWLPFICSIVSVFSSIAHSYRDRERELF